MGRPADIKVLVGLGARETNPEEIPILDLSDEGEQFNLKGTQIVICQREEKYKKLIALTTTKELKAYREAIKEMHTVISNHARDQVEHEVYWDEPEIVVSQTILQGLMKGLALLKSMENGSVLGLRGMHKTEREFVDELVACLLSHPEWYSWVSLGAALPILAETASDVFLNQLWKSIEDESGIQSVLLNKDESFGFSLTNYIRWSLEVIAWDSSNFSEAIMIIAEIAAVTPFEKVSNQFVGALINIFRYFLDQTTVATQKKRTVLKRVVQKYPDIGQKVILAVLPSRGKVILSTNHRPNSLSGYHHRHSDGIQVNEEYWEYIDYLVEILIHTKSSKVIAKLVPKLKNLNKAKTRNMVMDAISTLPVSIDEESGSPCWASLRSTLHWEIKWFEEGSPECSEEMMEFFLKQYERFNPSDIVQLYSWLFCYHPDPPYKTEQIVTGKDARVIEDRKKALENVLEQKDWYSLLLRLIDDADQPFIIAESLAEIDLVDKSDVLYLMLLDSNPKRESFFRAFVRICILERMKVSAFIDKALLQYESDSDVVRIVLQLLAIEPTESLWELIDGLDESVKNEYWTRYNAFRFEIPDDKLSFAMRKLLDVGRASAMIELLSHSLHYSKIKELPAGIDEILNSFLLLLDDPELSKKLLSSGYEIRDALDCLSARGINEELLFNLEMKLFPHVVDIGYQFPATTKLLNSKPSEFVKLVQWLYKSDSDSEVEAEDKPEKYMTHFAFTFVRKWKGIPGYSEENGLDKDVLLDWIRAVIDESAEIGRGKIVLYEIARILQRVPTDGVITTLHSEVMSIIETINSETLNEAVMIEIMNSRGVWTKGIGEGGEQERVLAQKYMKEAEAIEEMYPNSSFMLKRLAKKYGEDAVKADRKVD